MKKRIILITSFLLLIMLVGCKSSVGSNEKLPLTKENIQKVFAEEYNIGVDAIQTSTSTDKGSVELTFGTKRNVDRKDSPKLIKDIQNKLHENFNIGSNNHIELYNYNKKLLGSTQSDNDKIEIGGIPYINIAYPTSLELPKYSMSTKFNLLSPIKDSKVTATDDEDGDITNKVKLKNSEVLTKLGKQTLVYEVTDSDGNTRNEELNIEVTK